MYVSSGSALLVSFTRLCGEARGQPWLFAAEGALEGEEEGDARPQVADDAVEDDEADLGDPRQQAFELLDPEACAVLIAADGRVDGLDVVVVGAERDAELEQPQPASVEGGSQRLWLRRGPDRKEGGRTAASPR